jgi:natural product biosynthesis luciferase-like monooxygenase protein
MNNMIAKTYPCVVMGNESLLIQCSEILMARGHIIRAVVSRNADIIRWATSKNLRVVAPGKRVSDDLVDVNFDWLFSIANLDIIPQAVLDQARKGAVNFHDGPLPSYAGLNTPVWALINREKRHGITWHLIQGGIDEGDIIEQRLFDVSPADTAFTLNTKCFGAAIDSFATMLDKLDAEPSDFVKQDLKLRRYFGKNDLPAAAGRLDFTSPAEDLAALVHGLNHNGYWNPLTCAKIEVAGNVLLVGDADTTAIGAGDVTPGLVEHVSNTEITVATGFGSVVLRDIRDQSGTSVAPDDVIQQGDILQSPTPEETETLNRQAAKLIRNETFWRRELAIFRPAILPVAQVLDMPVEPQSVAVAGKYDPEIWLGATALWGEKLSENGGVSIAYRDRAYAQDVTPAYHADWLPVGFDRDAESCGAALQRSIKKCAALRKKGAYARDLVARDPAIMMDRMPDIGVETGANSGLISGTAVTLGVSEDGTAKLYFDANRIDEETAKRFAAQLAHLVAEIENGAVAACKFADVSILPPAELQQVLHDWNRTGKDYENACIHHFFERQVAKTPTAEALVFEGQSLSYQSLNERANQVAHVLREMGVEAGVAVGLFTERSLDLMIGALAIHKAGGAYVPLDPEYPADRISHVIADSQAPVILCQSRLVERLPASKAAVLQIDTDVRISAAPVNNPKSDVGPDDLAYLIYTSGSTGLPKGVMVEHRNVANFFAGMDERINHTPPGVWLAVTSLSFDISVLELFYTLARGFKVVLVSNESRVTPSAGSIAISEQKMDFSLFFWGNDDGVGRDKYKLLLEGSKYADKHGFCAVWTPERHFHAFGGPYPNPSVTGAAVAAVTHNLAVRSGSCVAPLHHTARIAEDWAVIDNLTNGRAGLGIAAGWQPDDFVLRPENTPPNNKPAMFKAIKDLRALWRGETVDFPTRDGTPFAVTTLPRPVSKELPIWVTIAGNPDTWREAGEIGANVLTHLLGQTIDVVADRIKIYHNALRQAGHDPADFTVTMMLHSYVADDREVARETARGPMKSYMGAAAGLIRQCAWEFPAFKRPKGVENAFEIDLATLSEDEVDGILEYAFERYFETAGLFGTKADCLQRVEQLKAIGVNEVACLIDYGIPVEKVLEGLVPLAEILALANQPTEIAADDFSLAAQIQRHNVTHLQCTPSMARMLINEPTTHRAFGRLQHLLIGGEALPGELVKTLAGITTASIENMYGPTETTIWSSSETAMAVDGLVNIGTPIANTQMYVLDSDLNPVPVGMPGELYIGGDGVARGYWQQAALTAERFLPNPFKEGGRMYRTGDLVRRRPDGKVDFLGRVDNQIKLRGHRIELGEIESALENIAALKQAVVVAREMNPGDTRLVAYFIAEHPLADVDLRARLGASLPNYMVPSHFVQLDALPLTPNRKIDRNALPAPMLAAKNTATATAKPIAKNSVEEKLSQVWTRILGVKNIGSDDNFFDLGGHSLLAVQAHREIKADLGISKLSITDIFRFPVLSALAARLSQQTDAPAAKKPQVDVAHQAQQRSDAMSKRRAMRARRGGNG